MIHIGKTYRHYKNQRQYKVLMTALNESDETPVVVYQALYEPHLIWVRPVASWCDTINDVPRFALCD